MSVAITSATLPVFFQSNATVSLRIPLTGAARRRAVDGRERNSGGERETANEKCKRGTANDSQMSTNGKHDAQIILGRGSRRSPFDLLEEKMSCVCRLCLCGSAHIRDMATVVS